MKYLEDKDLDKLDSDDIYNLTFDYDVLDDVQFLEILTLERFCKDEILYALIRNLHYFWTDLKNIKQVFSVVKKFLKNIKTEKKLIKSWKKNPQTILGTKDLSLEKLLLAALKANVLNMDELYNNKFYDVQKNDLLANLVEYEFISRGIQSSDFRVKFDYYLDLFKEFFNYSFKPDFRNEDTRRESQSLIEKRNSLLAEFIITVDKSDNDNYKQTLIDCVLNTLLYGDPRISEWKDFEYPKAQEIFKIWLNERDIKFFFDNLIDEDNDAQGRKAFWINYSTKIDKAFFIIGNDVPVNYKNREQISIFTKRASKNIFKMGSDDNKIKSNVFILKIKDIVILEFSEKNNACFVYTSDYYEKNIAPIFKTRYSRWHFKLQDLKAQDDCLKKFLHKGEWQIRIRNFLDAHM